MGPGESFGMYVGRYCHIFRFPLCLWSLDRYIASVDHGTTGRGIFSESYDPAFRHWFQKCIYAKCESVKLVRPSAFGGCLMSCNMEANKTSEAIILFSPPASPLASKVTTRRDLNQEKGLSESSGAQVFLWLWYHGLQGGTVANPTVVIVALYIENAPNVSAATTSIHIKDGRSRKSIAQDFFWDQATIWFISTWPDVKGGMTFWLGYECLNLHLASNVFMVTIITIKDGGAMACSSH